MYGGRNFVLGFDSKPSCHLLISDHSIYNLQPMVYSYVQSGFNDVDVFISNQGSYNFKVNNYLVKPASNIIPKLLINLLGAISLYKIGANIWLVVMPFIWWVLNDFIPVVYLLTELLLIKAKTWMWKLADPDGVLRQVGIYWAKKYYLKVSENGKVL